MTGSSEYSKLWKSDGTASGTEQVIDVWAGHHDLIMPINTE